MKTVDEKTESMLRAMAFLRMLVREQLLKPDEHRLALDIIDDYETARRAE